MAISLCALVDVVVVQQRLRFEVVSRRRYRRSRQSDRRDPVFGGDVEGSIPYRARHGQAIALGSTAAEALRY